MTTVKKAWEQVGKDLSDVGENIKKSGVGESIAQFGSDLGKSIVTTVKHGIKAVSEWADSIDDKSEKAEAEPADVIYAEAPAEEAAEIVKEAAENVEEAAEKACECACDAAEEVKETVCECACEASEAVEDAKEEAAEAVEAAAEEIDN